jgi:hypothetical protein
MQHANKTPADTEKKETKIKYPAETTAKSRENSPPDVSVYQTSSDNKQSKKMIQKQMQHKENTTRLYPENIPRKHSEESEQNYYNFHLKLNKKSKR